MGYTQLCGHAGQAASRPESFPAVQRHQTPEHLLPCPAISCCVHRAIRKLVTNNKRRHSLILALHAAGDGNGYGDLGKVYDAVRGMHDGLAAGTGWNTEAGARV